MTPPGAWFSFYIIQAMQVKGNNDDIRQLNVVRGWYEPSLLSFLYIYLFLRLHFIVMVWDMLLDECLIAMFSHEYFQYPGGALYVICYLHALFYSYSGIVAWYPPLNILPDSTWHMLTHVYDSNKKSSLDALLLLRVSVSLLCHC